MHSARRDTGCGGGHAILEMALKYPRLQFTGIDLSPEQIERAKKQSEHLKSRVSFIRCSATDIPTEDQTFNALYCMGSIKQWDDPVKGVRECLRVLRPRGWFLIADTSREFDRRELKKIFYNSFGFPIGVREVVFHTLSKMVFERSPNAAEMETLFQGFAIRELRVQKLSSMPVFAVTGRKASDGP